MTPEGLYNQMHQKFLCWEFAAYTSKGRLIPVLRYSVLQHYYIKNQAGEQRIKLEYYKNLNCNPSTFISSEYLNTNLSNEELISIIDARMRSDKWYEMSECFTGEQLSSIELPVGFLELTEWVERICKPFNVVSAGYRVVYADADGHSISTETVFDIFVPTEQLDTGVWYEFCFKSNRERQLILECIDKDHVWYENFFESNQENEAHWWGFPYRYENKTSLVLTATLGSWSFGISAYDSRYDPQLCNSYEVWYAPDGNGFLFMIKRKNVNRIWFKAAWLKSEGLDRNLCRQALRHWLE